MHVLHTQVKYMHEKKEYTNIQACTVIVGQIKVDN